MSEHVEEVDVLVIGAGPAGSVAAALLARDGHRVKVLEKAHFPRYHIGESMITGMIPVLEELGLVDKMDQLGFPRKHGITLVWGDDPMPWSTKFLQAGRYEYAWHVRRAEFDALLANRAQELGARIEFGAQVVAPVMAEPGTVCGVVWRDENGVEHTTRAGYTVDASGQARVLARKLTEVRREEDLNSVALWSYYSPYTTLPADQSTHILVEAVRDGWFWGIPVSEFEMSVGLVIQTAAYTEQAKSASNAEIYERLLAETQLVKQLVEAGTRKHELNVARDWSYNSAAFQGPGWLAIGDSAVFIDPLFSSGAWLATSGAWLAARALDTCLKAPEAEKGALEKFERVYQQIAKDILAYVRYFNDPTRRKEDYLEKANSAAQMVSEQSELGFISLISGISALPEVLDFDPMGWDNLPAAAAKAGLPTAGEQ